MAKWPARATSCSQFPAELPYGEVRKLVGIDASRYTTDIRTGTETYSRELLDAMADILDRPFSVRSYLNRADHESVNRLSRLGEVRIIPFPRLWTHARLSIELLTRRPDVLFVPSHVIPLAHPRSVVTIHDLGYIHEPAAHPPRQRRMLDLTTRWNARVAAHIIAISDTTRQDLLHFYGIPAEKITVIHHGVSDRLAPSPEPHQLRLRGKHDLPERFVLAVGTIQPRKNLPRLARAVAELRREQPDLALVLAGKRGWMADIVIAEIQRVLPPTAVRILGYVSQDELSALYSAASATALVSTYEGFGLPVLEAFRCGAPLVISETPALVEVAGNAALSAPADSVSAIAAQLASILHNPDLGAQLRMLGFARAADFTWRRTARRTIDVLDNVSRR